MKIKVILTNYLYILSLRGAKATKQSSPAVGSPRRSLALTPRDDNSAGYCISLETNELLHYCYPFYDLESNTPNLGLGMMTKAVIWAKEHGKKYIYLGSAQRPTDTYKLQFDGLEWFDGKKWQTNLEELKKVIKNHGVSNTVVDSG